MKSLRSFASTHFVQLQWNPRYRQMVKEYAKSAPGQKPAPASPYNNLIREQMEALKKQNQERELILRELLKHDEATVRAKIADENPLVRFIAIEIGGKKRLPVEKELIARLADPFPPIRQGARQALVRLARGADFGPEPSANAPQIALAMQHWQAWLRMQQDATDSRSSSYDLEKK